MKATKKPSPKKNRNKTIVFGLIVSAIFVAISLRNLDVTAVIAEIVKVNILILSLSLLTKALGFLMMSWRSHLLLRPLHNYPGPTLIRSIFVSFVGNNILPMRMGELLRVDYLARQGQIPHSACLAVVMLERLLDAFCLLLVLFIALPLMVIDLPKQASFLLLGCSLFLAVGGAIAISHYPNFFIGLCKKTGRWIGEATANVLTQKMERFATGLSALSSTAVVLAILGISIAYWVMSMASITCWIWAFGLDLPWYAPLVITVFTAFGTMLPSTPGYVGTYHYFMGSAMATFAVPAAQAASFAIVGHAMAIIPFTIIGIPFVLSDVLRRPAATPSPTAPELPPNSHNEV